MNKRKVANNLIALEGIDGCGKSSVHQMLQSVLATQSKIAFDSFPSKVSNIGRACRDLLSSNMDDCKKRALLYCVSAEMLSLEDILAKNNQIFISDRHVISTFAYQRLHFELDIIRFITLDISLPKHIIYLDLPPQESLQRLSSDESHQFDHFETLDRLTKIHSYYEDALKYCQDSGCSIYRIDASLPLKEVFDSVFTSIKLISSNFLSIVL